MTRVILGAMVFSALLSAGFLANTGAERGTPAVEEVMLQYIGWITTHSRFEYEGENLPKVRYLSVEALQRLQYGEEALREAETGNTRLSEIRALYDHRTNTIMLRDDLDNASFLAGHVMVHEMVHYLQYLEGAYEGSYCAGNLEPEAYAIQKMWQDLHFHPGPRPDSLYVHLLTKECGGPR